MGRPFGAYTKYNKNYKRLTIKLHLKNDEDIIEMLEAFDAPYTLIKQLLRQYAETVKEFEEHGEQQEN